MQYLWIAVAIGCIAGASMLRAPLDKVREDNGLVPPGNPVATNHPSYTLMTVVPGGLRAPIVNYLWIRADKLKMAGRYHEAMQLSELLCQLMPRFPGVWDFHAWNMAWNISVATHTPEERWLWVYNAVELLRDRGIALNPDALGLYKSLGWIFFSKMGGSVDEMHKVYKQRWAYLMQQLLGAPPTGPTKEVIDAFRPIADESLVDKRPKLQGRDVIQQGKLRELLASDPAAAAYAARLDSLGVEIGQGLLDVYNRFSRNQDVEMTRVGRAPRIENDADRALYALINDSAPAARAGLAKLLAFVRAQILWNVYKMDPAWMLHVMVRYNAPFDWRVVQVHGLYWVSYGMDQCGIGAGDFEALNTRRTILNSLKLLTRNGRLTYTENIRDPEMPDISWYSDWRYIEPTHQAHIKLAKESVEAENAIAPPGAPKTTFANNTYSSGHINFLTDSISMLYAGYRRQAAQKYLDYLKQNYMPDQSRIRPGDMWTKELDEFVFFNLHKDGRPIYNVVISQLTASIIAAYEQLALGNGQGYSRSMAYARRVYDMHQKAAAARHQLPSWDDFAAGLLAGMLTSPQATGRYMNLEARHSIYKSLDSRLQVRIYDAIAQPLRNQCANAYPPLDFDKAFPAPAGLKAYRATHTRTFAPNSR